ncbi:unnamed protein product, partial [Mesorhabditis belari]|uniref:Uncharacterized protein n=1 Tax=Mesorhabditis belari TaxID=2138241 RepID=A0AAF3FP34_9BILA
MVCEEKNHIINLTFFSPLQSLQWASSWCSSFSPSSLLSSTPTRKDFCYQPFSESKTRSRSALVEPPALSHYNQPVPQTNGNRHRSTV